MCIRDSYLGLASMIHEGDRLEENFDCVDLELTWAADPAKFDFVAAGQHLIERGAGSYPDGEFDCRCIYASPPVMAPDGRMWVYYMGGNGCHTNWRESALGRAEWQPDKFAAVSYTHLPSPDGPPPSADFPWPAGLTAAGPASVSYTHLDVYKRQMVFCMMFAPEVPR